MSVEDRIIGKKVNELFVLNSIFIFFTFIYLVAQIIFTKKVEDFIFIILLSFGTFFINFRQKELYENITQNEDANKYYKINDYNTVNEDMNVIFNNHLIDLGAILWGLSFGIVVSFLLMPPSNFILKTIYSLFLAMANIPTFLAVFRLILLLKYFIKLIKTIKFDYFALENYGANFIISLRNYILFTAVTYSTICLTSVIFTKINLGIAYILYAGSTAILIAGLLAISNYFIYRSKNVEVSRVVNIFNTKINNEIKRACEEIDYHNVEKLEAYIKYKDIVKNRKMDIEKIWTAIKLIGMAILPVLVQWALKIL